MKYLAAVCALFWGLAVAAEEPEGIVFYDDGIRIEPDVTSWVLEGINEPAEKPGAVYK